MHILLRRFATRVLYACSTAVNLWSEANKPTDYWEHWLSVGQNIASVPQSLCVAKKSGKHRGSWSHDNTTSLHAVKRNITQTITRGRTSHLNNISLRDLELWPVTLTFKLNLEWVNVNHRVEYPNMGTSQLVTRSTRHTKNSCDELTVMFYVNVTSWPYYFT